MQRVVWALLSSGGAFATAARFGTGEEADVAWRDTGGQSMASFGDAAGEPEAAQGFDGFLVMLALQHFLEKRPPPARWMQGQGYMVRHVELSPVRGPRVCGEPPVGAWGGLGSFPTSAEHKCSEACLADIHCGYSVFQVETGECTGFSKCSLEASVQNQSGTFIVNERTTYACSTSPYWCGACKHAGMSAAAADSCRVISGEWHCAGVATCVAAGRSEDISGSCTPGSLVCAGRGPRTGKIGSGLEQAAAVIAALDVGGAHPACPRYFPANVRHAVAETRPVAALPEKAPIRTKDEAWWSNSHTDEEAWWSSDHPKENRHTEASESKDPLEWTIASLRNEVEHLRETLTARSSATNLLSVQSGAAADAAEASTPAANASTGVPTRQRVCSEEDKAVMNAKWLQDGSRLEQMCSVYSPPAEYKAMGDMPAPAMWMPEEGTPDCCDAGQSCEVAGFRILENYLTLYSLCVPTANWTAT